MNARTLIASLLLVPAFGACAGPSTPARTPSGNVSPAVAAPATSITGKIKTSTQVSSVRLVFDGSTTRGPSVPVDNRTFTYPLPASVPDTLTQPITEQQFGIKECPENRQISNTGALVASASFADFFDGTSFVGYGAAGTVDGNLTTAHIWMYSSAATDVTSQVSCTNAQGVKRTDTVHLKLQTGWNATVLTVAENADGSETSSWYTQPVGETTWSLEVPLSTQEQEWPNLTGP